MWRLSDRQPSNLHRERAPGLDGRRVDGSRGCGVNGRRASHFGGPQERVTATGEREEGREGLGFRSTLQLRVRVWRLKR